MKMYGSYSDADLDHWQNLPMNSYVLAQSAFGAWLMRRDENKAKQFPAIPLDKVKEVREEISDWDVNKAMNGCSEPFRLGVARGLDIASEILDRLISEVEE